MDLHRRIHTRRLELGLSKARVFREAGISRQAYDPIESGEAKPNVETLVGIARALGTTVGALLGETELPAATGGAA